MQRRDRDGEPLGGQRGDVVGAAGAGQQVHGALAHSFGHGGRLGTFAGLFPG